MLKTARRCERARIALAAYYALCFATAASARAGHLATLLSSDTSDWPGALLRLETGPATAGVWAAPAWGDINGDKHSDLVLGSGYGDVIVYLNDGTGKLAAPTSLLILDLPLSGVQWNPAVPCLSDVDGDAVCDLVLLMGERLLVYAGRTGGFAPGREALSQDGKSLALTLADAGATAVPVGIAPGISRGSILVSTLSGEVWHVSVSPDYRIAAVSRLMVEGTPVSFGEGVRLCVGDIDGDGALELIGAGRSTVYVAESLGDGFGPPKPLQPQIRTPDGIEPMALAPAVMEGGQLLLGTAWGTVMTAQVLGNNVVVTGWVLARHAPLDVGLCAAPWPCDWNGDGETDLVVGSADGLLRVFLAAGNGLYHMGAVVSDSAGPIRAPGEQLRPCFPALADLDGDRDLDLLLGEAQGHVKVWRNDRTFTSLGDMMVGGTPFQVPGVAAPFPIDWDDDGDLDLFVGSYPLPTDWSGEPPPYPSYPGVRYIENEARATTLPQLAKTVLVDLLVRSGDCHGDAAVLEPWHLCILRRTRARDETLVTTRAGLFLFDVQTLGPAYPRFVLSGNIGVPPPLRPRGPAWAVVPLQPSANQVLVGLAPYGFVCRAVLR